MMLPLRKPDAQGRKVFLLRPGLTDPNKIKISDVMKVNVMIMDILLEEDDTYVIKGVVGILDLADVTLGHAMQMTPSVVKKMTACSEVKNINS